MKSYFNIETGDALQSDILWVKSENGLVKVRLKARVDSTNQTPVFASLKALVEQQGPSTFGIDLSATQFLSLTAMQFLGTLALELQEQGRSLAVFGASEKLKRQMELFTSPEALHVYRNEGDWLAGRRSEPLRGFLNHPRW